MKNEGFLKKFAGSKRLINRQHDTYLGFLEYNMNLFLIRNS